MTNRYSEAEIISRLNAMRTFLEQDYVADDINQLHERVKDTISYLAETTKLLADAMWLKGEAELVHVEETPSRIKILCHNETTLVDVVKEMNRILSKANSTLITQISLWKAENLDNRIGVRDQRN